jgi:hypothetical protein
MRERFSNKQIVTMVVAVCAAVVLAPIGVFAATGTLVNIADPSIGSRQARVSSGGGLLVESRSYPGANSFNLNGSRLGLGYINLISTTAPTRIAVTEVTLTGQGPAGQQEALLEAFVRTTGTAGCGGPGTAGYTRFTMRRVAFNNQGTLQVEYNGPPLLLPAGASGQPTCFGVTVISIPSGSATYVGGSGCRFTG